MITYGFIDLIAILFVGNKGEKVHKYLLQTFEKENKISTLFATI